MAEPSPELKIAARRLSNWASMTLAVETQRSKNVQEINSGEDRFIVWIVALSSGAIGLVLTAARFSGISKGEGFIVFLFFGLSILSGVLYRWALKDLQAANVSIGHYNQTKVMMGVKMKLAHPDFQTDFPEILRDAANFEQWDDPTYLRLRGDMNWWGSVSNKLSYAPPAAFLLGVLALIVVAFNNWEAPAGDTAKPVPEVQSRP